MIKAEKTGNKMELTIIGGSHDLICEFDEVLKAMYKDMEYTTSSNTICWDGRTGYKQLMLKSSSSKRYKDFGNNISSEELDNWYNIEPLWAKYKEGFFKRKMHCSSNC